MSAKFSDNSTCVMRADEITLLASGLRNRPSKLHSKTQKFRHWHISPLASLARRLSTSSNERTVLTAHGTQYTVLAATHVRERKAGGSDAQNSSAAEEALSLTFISRCLVHSNCSERVFLSARSQCRSQSRDIVSRANCYTAAWSRASSGRASLSLFKSSSSQICAL